MIELYDRVFVNFKYRITRIARDITRIVFSFSMIFAKGTKLQLSRDNFNEREFAKDKNP